MEKLTHDFTHSLHDNHPLIEWANTLLQCDLTQQLDGNQCCVCEEAPVRRMAVCLRSHVLEWKM